MYKEVSSSNMQGPRKREGTGGWSGDGNTQFNNGILKKKNSCFQIVTLVNIEKCTKRAWYKTE